MFSGNCVIFIHKFWGKELQCFKRNWINAASVIYLVTIVTFANGGNYVEKLFEFRSMTVTVI